MADLVRYEVRDGVAVVTVDNPPVNALSPGVPEYIEGAFARAGADPDVKAVVLIGSGTTFVAGADIRTFGSIPDRDSSLERSRLFHARLRHMEDCPKPTVAAIHGAALGGGLEVAMACHYRVAAPQAKVGQPEVLLGILPGAGGTQRLPRLAGVKTAIEMCTRGSHVPAPQAQADGILDELVEGDLLEGAVRFALRQSAPRRVRDLNDKLGDPDAARALCEAARAGLKKTARGARAPFACVDAIEAAATMDFNAGSEREIGLFADCVLSRESKAMVKLFFAEREVAKIPDVPRDTPAAEIRSAAVVGAGTMGGGIAMNFANAGIPVLLKEISQEALDKGLAAIRANYESSVAKGKLSREEMDRRLGLIRPTLSYAGFDEVDLAVEAAFENMELKKAVFFELGKMTRPECILASNTSTLDIDEFAKASGRPDKVIGHHYFSPANVMRLLEIVRGKATGKETIATSLKLARKLNKVGVVVGNCFGFVANRMLAYYMREAYLLLEEGASVPQIDGALTAFGFPVGPFAMQDIAGIDVGWRIRQYLKSIGKTRAEGPQSVVPDRLYELGRYGQKTGAGWYRYEPGSRVPIPDPMVAMLAAEAAKERGVQRREISNLEILNRVLTALANEGANVLDEKIAQRAGDIDVIYSYGFGFPRHEGGPMFWADHTGLDHVLANVRDYHNRLGDHWRPSPLLEWLATAGKSFYSYSSAAAMAPA